MTKAKIKEATSTKADVFRASANLGHVTRSTSSTLQSFKKDINAFIIMLFKFETKYLVIFYLTKNKLGAIKINPQLILSVICTGGGARTPNPRFWRPMLYQLSHTRV